MKVIILLALAIVFSSAIALGSNKDEIVMRSSFRSFMAKYHKSYESIEEEERRFTIFKANIIEAERRTRMSPMAVHGVTKFSDLTREEFAGKYLMNISRPSFQEGARVAQIDTSAPVPSTFDWRNTPNIVSPVKNQQQCGSCYIFSATETVESVWARAKGELPILSEQQSVDCDSLDGGCGGGWPYNVYQYMISTGGVESEVAYPYTAEDGKCAFNSADVIAKISNWKYVVQNLDENAMQSYLHQNSPISICVDASTWSSYVSGVIMGSACGTEIDHCVQATGWSIQKDPSGKDITVWNVRNSWADNWGNGGYVYLAFGQNTCGLASVVTVPIV